MVFGNLGDDCATGVAFTRDPATGEKGIYGEYLPNAQGEDVVAGIRTPLQISLAGGRKWAERKSISEEERKAVHVTLEERFPQVFRELLKIAQTLERHFRDMQDLEFTIERGRLFMLQTRTGKRTAEAALRIAVDMAKERLIDRREALMRVEPVQLEQLLHPRLDPAPKKRSWPVACRLRPARQRVKWCFPPTKRWQSPQPGARPSWSGSRPLRKTSTECRSRRAF